MSTFHWLTIGRFKARRDCPFAGQSSEHDGAKQTWLTSIAVLSMIVSMSANRRETWVVMALLASATAASLPTQQVVAKAQAGEDAETSKKPPATTADDPLAHWRSGVRIRPVSAAPGRHTIHSYYVCNPESPDGRRVLFYVSTRANGYSGDLCILDRVSGQEKILVRDVSVEDAHRAACQQWISGGRRVAYHEVRDGRWRVVVVDAETGMPTVTVDDRQIAFGQPDGDLLPIYGSHWKPGPHRDLELLNAATGEVRTVLTADAVEKRYGTWLKQEFDDKPISIFFPVLSPDRSRVFFKIAAGNGGNEFMSKDASHRQGLISYALERNRFLFLREKWGHPAWHPDSSRIIEMGNLLLDAVDGSVTRIPNLPNLRGSHPSISPDGRLMVTDGLTDSPGVGGKSGEWCVMVGDLRGNRHEVLHRFDNTRGAKSWRRSDPHPVFSSDSRRIYFNVSDGDFTQLFVAEMQSE